MSTLRVLPRGPGSVEWRVEAPSPLQGRSLARAALGGVLLAVLVSLHACCSMQGRRGCCRRRGGTAPPHSSGPSYFALLVGTGRPACLALAMTSLTHSSLAPCLQPAAWLGAGWPAAAVAGGVSATALALLHTLLSVQWESLTYVRLLGVQLETRRRCSLGGTSLFLPLRMLQGIIIHEVSGSALCVAAFGAVGVLPLLLNVKLSAAASAAARLPVHSIIPQSHALCTQLHPLSCFLLVTLPSQEVSATRADFYLALPLQPDSPSSRNSSPTPGSKTAAGNGTAVPGSAAGGAGSSSLRRRRQLAGGSKRLEAEDCEVQVVFPRLRPRLSLLRQVYQQLSPLLAHDLEALRAGADAQPGAEQLAAVPAAVPLPQPVPAAEVEESEQSMQIEEQRMQHR